MKQSYYTLNNGNTMPKIGLGTWKSDHGKVYKAVIEALKYGYKHIDCAFIYKNEEEVGNAIKDAIKDKIVTREEIFITSKLWCNSHKPLEVVAAIKHTLHSLKLDYLDMYLIHWPIAFKNSVIFPNNANEMIPLEHLPISETWQGMEEAFKSGLTKNIGVSNFSIKKLQELLKNSVIKPANNQVELHPYLQQNGLLEFCKNNNVLLTAYSPLGSPSKENIPQNKVLLQDNTIKNIADKHKVTSAQVLIAWGLSRNVAVIPKSVTTERIQQNLDASNIVLDNEDLADIAKLDMHHRYVLGSVFALPNSGYTLNNIWDEEVTQKP